MEWNGDIGGMQVGFYFYHLLNFDILISRVFQGYRIKLEYYYNNLSIKISLGLMEREILSFTTFL